jgi:hypothetical protein
MGIKRIKNISVDTRMNMIYARLRFNRYKTETNNEKTEFLEQNIKLAKKLSESVVSYIIYDIDKRGSRSVYFKGKSFESEKLASFLKNSRQIVLMSSTAGKRISDYIKKEMKDGDIAGTVIIDAAASDIADAGLDWLMKHINTLLRSSSKKLTDKRFSPGYGDLKLHNQLIIYNCLKLNETGITINDSYMLEPEKTVLAVAGIERCETDDNNRI